MIKIDKILLSFLILFSSIIFLAHISLALEKETHEFINKKIARNQSIINSYLKDQLGFAKGITTPFLYQSQSRSVEDWIGLGGKYEDEPMYTRSLKHFHDPLEAWDDAGFKGLNASAILWAHDQGLFGSLTGGNFAWKDVREYYYAALTGKNFNGIWLALTQSEKEIYYGATFRGIGQIMHLVEDMSVPAHTRDDSHIAGYHYETAVDKFRDKLDPVFVNAIVNPRPFDPSILDLPPNPLAPIPIAKIFDADRYDGYNASAGINQGLAEYTSANFFSEDTIFDNAYPFPNELSTDLQSYTNQNPNKLPVIVFAEDGIPDTNFYIRKIGDGETIEHFVKPGYLTKEAVDAGNPIYVRTFILDDTCYKDYASLLLPRAVGYSAGLLNYFFRGNIEITLPDKGVYSFSDASNSGFTNITLLAKNKTLNDEEMTDGSIELVLKYKPSANDDYVYKVVPEKNGVRIIPRDNAVELTFDLTQNPLPFTVMDIDLQIVYKGELGNLVKENNAVAIGFKDISEPTPIDIYNNMDKICINGNWYDAGTQDAIDQVDVNQDGRAYGANEWDVYAHDLQEIYIKFYNISNVPQNASPTLYDFRISNLAAPGSRRVLYVLGDDQFHYSFDPLRARKDSNDWWTHVDPPALYHGYTIKDIIGDPPIYYNFRGVSMWPGAGFIYINAPYPTDSQCSLGLL
jgi:hypothetical protein